MANCEKKIKKVMFEFSDGEMLTLRGKKLAKYKLMCDLFSDYLLPADESSKIFIGKVIKGFTPCPLI